MENVAIILLVTISVAVIADWLREPRPERKPERVYYSNAFLTTSRKQTGLSDASAPRELPADLGPFPRHGLRVAIHEQRIRFCR